MIALIISLGLCFLMLATLIIGVELSDRSDQKKEEQASVEYFWHFLVPMEKARMDFRKKVERNIKLITNYYVTMGMEIPS